MGGCAGTLVRCEKRAALAECQGVTEGCAGGMVGECSSASHGFPWMGGVGIVVTPIAVGLSACRLPANARSSGLPPACDAFRKTRLLSDVICTR